MENKETKISDLYPELSEEEQMEAGENLKRYLDLVQRIYDGLSEEEKRTLALRQQWNKRSKDESQNK